MSVELLRQELATDLLDVLRHTATYLSQATARACQAAGLSEGEATALLLLASFPQGISQSDWARILGSSRQYAHATALTLAERGWLGRKRAGRMTYVHLTKEGADKIAHLRPALAEALAAATAHVAIDDMQRLMALLGKVPRQRG